MGDIDVRECAKGVLEVSVRKSAYRHVAVHWERQLTGANATKWGRLFIDRNKTAMAKRRSDALWQEPWSKETRGAFDRDECPGAMFICETQAVSDVELCDASANRSFGRDLVTALDRAIATLPTLPRAAGDRRPNMWEVRFRFRP